MTTEAAAPGQDPEPKVPESVPASPPSQPSAESPPVEQATPESESRPDKGADEMPKWPRYGQLHAQKKEAEARAIAAERRLREIESRYAQTAQTPVDHLPLEQQDQHRTRQVLQYERLEDAKRDAAAEQSRLYGARRDAFLAKVEAVRDRMPDFDDVFWPTPVSDVMADIMAESPKAAEIAYWLGKNPHEARRISNLPPHVQGAEMARIETRVASVSPRRTSNAPNPPPVLNGGASPGASDPAAMSMAEYAKWRTAQMKAQRAS